MLTDDLNELVDDVLTAGCLGRSSACSGRCLVSSESTALRSSTRPRITTSRPQHAVHLAVQGQGQSVRLHVPGRRTRDEYRRGSRHVPTSNCSSSRSRLLQLSACSCLHSTTSPSSLSECGIVLPDAWAEIYTLICIHPELCQSSYLIYRGRNLFRWV